MMDVCILEVSKKILKCPATHGNICLGALVGAALTCLTVILPVSSEVVKFVLFHGPINILMIKAGLRIKWNKTFIRAYAVVYISAFLIGGIFTALKQYVRESSVFFALAIASYFSAMGIFNFITYMGQCKNTSCEVMLCHKEKKVKVRALIDTGNRLRDGITGKPVSVISRQTAELLWEEIPAEGLRYISYHTIGKKEGIMPLFSLERMCLYLDEEIWIRHVLVAVSEENISHNEYEMILNPDVK